MSQNIKLNDGEVAVVIGNANFIMNVNTVFEIVGKLFVGAGCDCLKEKKDEKQCNDFNKNVFNKNDFNKNNNKSKVNFAEEAVKDHKNHKAVASDLSDLFSKVYELKTETGGDKVPVIAFAFDSDRAKHANDLRAGVGKCIKRFDSMAAADWNYGVSAGTVSSVVNTWLPYMHHTGAMNPMIGDKKNYRFSSKYNGKSLRWSFAPLFDRKNNITRVVVFRADAIPQFILDRYTKKNS